jgi:RpiR family transcriptional regulator, murPQ operon repressor
VDLDELQNCVDIIEKAETAGLFGIGSSLLAARDMYLKFLRLN